MSLQQLLYILWYRKLVIIVIFTLIVGVTMTITLMLPKQYTATTSIVIDQRSVDPLTGMALPTQMLSGYIVTQVDIISSHNVARRVVNKLKINENPQIQEDYASVPRSSNIVDWVADLILKNLEVKPSRESSMISVNYTSVDPKFSAVLSNAFAEAYLETSVELRAQPAKATADWFDAQLLSLRERLEQTQAKLSDYQQKYGIIVTDDRLDIENARLADLSRQLVESQARTNEMQSRRNLLQKGGGGSESLLEVLQSGLISTLKGEVASKEANLALLSKRMDKNHPQIKQAEAEIASLQQKISSEIRKVENSMASSLASSKQRDEILAQALADQKIKVLELKKQHDEIAVLNNEVVNAQKTYDLAMQRTVQTRMESEVNHTNIAILNAAIAPEFPTKPRVFLNFILSFILGGALGIGSALFAEFIDRRVRSAAEVSDLLELPVFAVVSEAKRK